MSGEPDDLIGHGIISSEVSARVRHMEQHLKQQALDGQPGHALYNGMGGAESRSR